MHELDFYYPTPTINMAQVITRFKRYFEKNEQILRLEIRPLQDIIDTSKSKGPQYTATIGVHLLVICKRLLVSQHRHNAVSELHEFAIR